MKENKDNKDLVMSEEDIRIVKTGTTQSLSDRSTLTYEIACKEDKTIYIRLTENTGSGMFSKVWVPLAQILLLLAANDKPITSSTIRTLYSGSANSVGFLLAVLKHEGLVKNIEENSQSYTRADPKKFTDNIHALLESEFAPQKKSAKAKTPEVPINQEPSP